MERHGIKPLPSLDLMKRDLEIYPLSARAYRSLLERDSSTAKANQLTHADPEESTAIKIVSASQLF
jgi:hypothetical protein